MLPLTPEECIRHKQKPLRSLHNTKSISRSTSPLSCVQELPVMRVLTQTHMPPYLAWTNITQFHRKNPNTSCVLNIPALNISVSQYLRQPAVLVRAVSHSRWRGLQLSSPPSFPLSQPECGTITSSDSAWSAWSTISILTES